MSLFLPVRASATPVRAFFVVSGGLAGVDAGFITAGAIGYEPAQALPSAVTSPILSTGQPFA